MSNRFRWRRCRMSKRRLYRLGCKLEKYFRRKKSRLTNNCWILLRTPLGIKLDNWILYDLNHQMGQSSDINIGFQKEQCPRVPVELRRGSVL